MRSRCYVEGVEYDAVDYFRPFGETPYVKADLAEGDGARATLIRAEFGFDISPETHEPLMPLDVVEQFQADLPQLQVITVPGHQPLLGQLRPGRRAGHRARWCGSIV